MRHSSTFREAIMHTAVLSRTRAFFGIQDGSIFGSLKYPVRRLITGPPTKNHDTNRIFSNSFPRTNVNWAVSAVLVIAFVGTTHEPQKNTSHAPIVAEQGATSEIRNELLDRQVASVTVQAAPPSEVGSVKKPIPPTLAQSPPRAYHVETCCLNGSHRTEL
jgi:hypothetical protein